LPELGNVVEGLTKAMEIDMDKWDIDLMKMMIGRMGPCPFTIDEINRGRDFLIQWVTEGGSPLSPSTKDTTQAPRLRLLQAILRKCGGPDAEAVDAYCWGVRLGYRARMQVEAEV
jgi:hypothetical protein